MALLDPRVCQALQQGQVIPACPLALDARRRLDERRQRALVRYYLAAGAGGLAVGVHTTQFAIRRPEIGLLRPVLELAAEELDRSAPPGKPIVRIAGVCGPTAQALDEAALARELGYHYGLLSLAALPEASDDELLAHSRSVGEVLPIMGFYLQPAVGGRVLSYSFWRRLVELPSLVAIKLAPFDRYRTLDVVRAVVASRRDDMALYTGNDDSIVHDLITPFRFTVGGATVERRIVGGLLGQWAIWTRKAVELLEQCRRCRETGLVPASLLAAGGELTDANAAIFDAANGFAGCIPGIHEVLRRQGLLAGTWCLEPAEGLSPGQAAEIERVQREHPDLIDDAFVAAHLDQWLSR
jgi:dihydrodipicolinate synthase/N-acetylneuraminate lyase